MINMDKVTFAYHLVELWTDFLDWHEKLEPHLGGVTSQTLDEVHEPTFMEFMDWIVDQVEMLEPQIAAAEEAEAAEPEERPDPVPDNGYCDCLPGFISPVSHRHRPRPREEYTPQ